MTYMRSWKSHRLTSHTWLGLNPQIGRRPLSRIVVPLVLRVWFQHKIGYFYKQSKISTRRVWFYTQSVLSTHTRVSLIRMLVNMTLTSIISTRSVISTGTNVIPTRTSVISTHTRLISTRRVRFPHAENDFTRRMWFYTQSVVFTHTRVILTRMRVNMTLTSMIYTRKV
jgi:hypothetical protein